MNNKGVTMIELVVVLTVFMIIISVTVGIFLSIIQQQRSILAQQELLNQTSYAIEYMSRDIKGGLRDIIGGCISSNGYSYLLTRLDGPSGFYNGIKFLTKDNICKEFFWDTDGILKEIKNGGQPQNILSSKFVIRYVRFVLNGDKNHHIAAQSDLFQPRITILLDTQANQSLNQPEKIIQTTISQENLNEP